MRSEQFVRQRRQIVQRCLAKDPADRYQRAADVRIGDAVEAL